MPLRACHLSSRQDRIRADRLCRPSKSRLCRRTRRPLETLTDADRRRHEPVTCSACPSKSRLSCRAVAVRSAHSRSQDRMRARTCPLSLTGERTQTGANESRAPPVDPVACLSRSLLAVPVEPCAVPSPLRACRLSPVEPTACACRLSRHRLAVRRAVAASIPSPVTCRTDRLCRRLSPVEPTGSNKSRPPVPSVEVSAMPTDAPTATAPPSKDRNY